MILRPLMVRCCQAVGKLARTRYLFVVSVVVSVLIAAGHGLPGLATASSPVEINFTSLLSIEGFLVDSILQLTAVNLMGSEQEELLLVGKNYEAREAFLYVLDWHQGKFRVLWKSPNLYSSPGHLVVAAGDFMGAGYPQVLLMGDRKDTLLRWANGRLQVVWEGESGFSVQDIACLRQGPGEQDLLVATTITEKTPEYAIENINILRWTEQGFEVVASSENIGVIRSIATGAITGSSTHEIIIDTGFGTRSGQQQVWRFDGAKLIRLTNQELATAAAFGMAVFPEGNKVVISDDRGKVRFFTWENGELQRVGSEISLGWALVSVAAGRLFADTDTPVIVVAEYPNTVHLIAEPRN